MRYAVAAVLAVGLLQAQQAGKVLGVVTEVSAERRELTIKSDSGDLYLSKAGETARVVRVDPGEKDLNKAKPAEFSDVAVGDRLLARGEINERAKTLIVNSLVVMSKSALSGKQARELAEWRQTSLAGVVESVDAATRTVRIKARAAGGSHEWTLDVPPATSISRYADHSVRFEDAQASTLEAIQPSNQLRVLGARDEANGRITAARIVFGSFRTLGGELVSVKPAANEVVLKDVQTKQKITLHVPGDAKLRRLPPMAGRFSVSARRPGTGNGGGPNLEQMVERMPPASIGDLQPGDAVIVSVMNPPTSSDPQVISLVAGVDFILRAPAVQVSEVLGNWTLDVAMP